MFNLKYFLFYLYLKISKKLNKFLFSNPLSLQPNVAELDISNYSTLAGGKDLVN